MNDLPIWAAVLIPILGTALFNAFALSLITTLVRAWVRLYTANAREEVRDRRRAEIESDIWEHLQYWKEQGHQPGTMAPQLLARWLLGIGDDLGWWLDYSHTANRFNAYYVVQLSRLVASLNNGVIVLLDRADRVHDAAFTRLDTARARGGLSLPDEAVLAVGLGYCRAVNVLAVAMTGVSQRSKAHILALAGRIRCTQCGGLMLACEHAIDVSTDQSNN